MAYGRKTLEGLHKELDGSQVLLPNMGSAKKSDVLMSTLAHELGYEFPVQVLHELIALFEETDFPDAELVSALKALWLLGALKEIYKDDPAMLRNLATAGADTVFKLNGINLSKLERVGRPLLEQEVLAQYEWLKSQLVAKSATLEWEIATTIANGGVTTVSEVVTIQAKPIDLELFNAYFWEAVDNGLLLKSNSRMAMIEMLILSKAIKTVSVHPKNHPDQKKLVRQPNEFLLEQIRKDIISTIPGAALLGLAEHTPNVRGYRV